MPNLHKPGTTLWLAQLLRGGEKPTAAKVIEVAYHAPGKKHGTHTVKIHRRKFPVVVEAEDLAPTPTAAQERLIAKIQDAINEHALSIDRLYTALLQYKESALIDWSSIKPTSVPKILVSVDELPANPEPTIIHMRTNLQNAIASHAQSNRAKTRLIMDAQRRALHNAGRLQQIARREEAHTAAKLPAEIPMLIDGPEEDVIPPALTNEPLPPEPTDSGTVTSAPDEDPARDADSRHIEERPHKPARKRSY